MIAKNFIDKFPLQMMKKYSLVPWELREDKLRVFALEKSTRSLEILKLYYDYDIELILVDKEIIGKKIDLIKISLENKNLFKDDSSISQAGVVKLFNDILNKAISLKATDIHLETYENFNRIRFRIHGRLKEIYRLNDQDYKSLKIRIKVLADLDIAEVRKPQDGRIMIKMEAGKVDIRISIIPTIYGEKIVLRILDENSFDRNINSLGISNEDLEKVKYLYHQPYGMILITGPAGSGKTTTLYSILKDINDTSKNIITIEDPIEYTISGINQTQINENLGYSFHKSFESVLRQDPNVIVLGEIRNEKICELSLQSAITGHLILSTLHTNNSISTITRLKSMNIAEYLIRDGVIGIIAQRLVSILCPKCKKKKSLSSLDRKTLKLDEDIDIYDPVGCESCVAGYIKRELILEVLVVTKEVKEFLIDFKAKNLEDYFLKQGIKTIDNSVKDLLIRGETSMDEYFKVGKSI